VSLVRDGLGAQLYGELHRIGAAMAPEEAAQLVLA